MKKVICGAICMLLFYHAASAQFRYVSPMPGTKYHNPERSIILREGSLLDVASLHGKDQFIVEGSKSKLHAVQRKLADDGKTILLIPEIPFALEEEIKVTVKAGIRKLSGEKLEGYTFNFYTRSAHSLESQQQFATHRKKILAEEFGVNKESTSKGPAEGGPPFTIDVNINPAPGALFYHNISLLGAAVEQSQIMTSDGHFIFRHESQVKGINFDINRNGYLTSYNEATESYDMFDSSYNTIGTYKAGNGYVTDIHDFQVFQDGHSFIAGLDYQTIDMTVYDPDYSEQATVIGAILQELDASKNVIFEWRSWDYVDIPEALHETLSFGFIDYVHANSMELDVDGNILLSCRNLDQVIKIDRNTGVMIWRLGGIKNEFVFLNDTLRFNYQHDARRIANGNITLYDNGNYHPVKASFAKEYRIDEVNKTVSKVWSYSHPFINGKTVRGFAMGNVQRLPNGNTLINWGSIYAGSVLGKGSPNLTEVDSSGNIVWEMTLNESNKGVIYRAHRYEWTPCARSAEKSLKESNITQSSAKLSWGKATNATGYTVFYKRKTDSTWNSKNANGNSKVLNDLEPGTTYQWYLQSKCDTNIITVSANSKTRKFATLPLKNAQAEKTALSMQVYPNPCGSWVKVVGFGEEKLEVSLLDLSGHRLPVTLQYDDGQCVVDLQKIEAGVYFLQVLQEGWQEVKKIEVLKSD